MLDSHHHLWDLSVRDQPWLHSSAGLAPLLRNFGTQDLAPLATAAGVSQTVVVQTVTEPGETPELLAAAAAQSLVTAVVGWTDLTSPAVADDLSALLSLPGSDRLAGIRHPVLIEPDPRWLTRPDVLRGLAAVAAVGLTYDVVARPHQLPAAATAAAARPDLMFVLDHLGNVEVEPQVDEQWAAAFRQFAALPNTICKLSGILGAPPPAGSGPDSVGPDTVGPDTVGPDTVGPDTVGPDTVGPDTVGPDTVAHMRPYYEIALEAFGPDRMMFGSDWPVSTLGAPYGDVVAAARTLTRDLSLPEQQAIFSETARRVYKIGDSR
jgi:L-fuconolactonase